MTSTIYDVASRAGVSIATVSRAINAPQTVNTTTLQRIQEAIDELGFIPKAEATARARRIHRQIGVLAPFFMHYPSFTQRLRGVASALRDTGFELVVYNVDTPEHARSYLHTLPITRRLDGLLIISLKLDDQEAIRLVQHRLPTVLIEGAHPKLASVEIDNVAGGEVAAEYLVAKGHARIGFVGGDRQLPGYAIGTSELRYRGFSAVLGRHGLAPVLPGFAPRTSTHEEARLQAVDLLQQPERPTAIFAGNDTLALGVLKAARELGLSVPDDIAVLGFDDADFAEYIGLSTVSQSLEESGRLAVEMLLSMLSDPTRSNRRMRLPLQVLERDTA
ncbi:MAG: LacI family DNA-binding transcriptional regulator [Caldilineaceae bacterium]|jgi:LacI family transcriptional regulator|nr:LacI family DNA-binding transcriptional regulator [Caldilineaceae bacterium]